MREAQTIWLLLLLRRVFTTTNIHTTLVQCNIPAIHLRRGFVGTKSSTSFSTSRTHEATQRATSIPERCCYCYGVVQALTTTEWRQIEGHNVALGAVRKILDTIYYRTSLQRPPSHHHTGRLFSGGASGRLSMIL